MTKKAKHIGIAARGAPGAALCYTTICLEGANLMGRLAEWWLGSWDLPTSSDITALSLDERGCAGAWVRNYGGPPGTGFVYLAKEWDSDVLDRIGFIAEYRPG